jgi:hypothetical protein
MLNGHGKHPADREIPSAIRRIFPEVNDLTTASSLKFHDIVMAEQDTNK